MWIALLLIAWVLLGLIVGIRFCRVGGSSS